MMRLIFISIMVALCLSASAQTVRRGRSESPLLLFASNVAGNGNITLFAQPMVSYSSDALRFDPLIGGYIGISDIMQLTAQIVPITTKGLGPTEIHLHITLPGNERLRFFGIAVIGDLFLSTTQDIISATTNQTKPEYKPFLLPSLAVDLDWIAMMKTVPLKTYLSIGMADNPLVLYRYDQLALRAALELKLFSHALSVGGGLGLYQEKRNTLFPAGDRTYEQYNAWVSAGGRYRILDWLSLCGELRVAVLRQVKAVNPLQSEIVNFAVRLEAPILFRETNTEAIRTLVFMEQVNDKKSIQTTQTGNSGKGVLGGLNSSFSSFDDNAQSFDYSRERADLIKRREETQAKMDEIEKMFNAVSLPLDTMMPVVDSLGAIK